jgi:hypothetical protein
VTTAETPWVSRFTSLTNPEEIRKRVEVRPMAVSDIGNMNPLEAGLCAEHALQRVFYPSAQCLDFLFQWTSIARWHCLEMYEDSRAFVEGIYLREAPLPEFCIPWCLSGLAGVGKSALVSALDRLMPKPNIVIAADGTEFPLVSHRTITVRASSTSRDVLTQFAQREGSVRVLKDFLRRLAYRDGWALIVQDEFQFATQSEQASTRVAQMILAMCYIGVPPLYIANYSLLHRLQSRNQEERHRLLAKVQFLKPDKHDSNDWRTLLHWYREVAPSVFTFNADDDATKIHILTAGVKRHVVALLSIAFAMTFSKGGVVSYSVLEKAYKSSAYATYRNDVEALAKLDGAFRNSRKDLWSPIAEVVDPSEFQELQSQRQMLADAKALESAMTVEERRKLTELSNNAAAASAKSNHKKASSRRTKKADAQQLRENDSWYQGKL